jgi:predicted CXXCH cytochrome family protein
VIRRRLIPSSLAIALLAGGCGRETSPPAPDSAAPSPATFVGLAACADCHEEETRIFAGSDHDLAMDLATADTVLGDFDDATFTHGGVTSMFSRRGDDFVVRTDGPDGALAEYTVDYTFGVRPLQQYLVAIEPGRYQALSVCWDTRPADEGGQRWFHLYGDETIAHDDELHWTRPLQNWNYMCAECHSTRLDKGYDAAANRYDTTWSEIDVSCEACHGPGSNHVAWAEAVEAGADAGDDDGLVVRLKVPDEAHWTFAEDAPTAHRATPLVENVQIDTCGRCHSRRTQVWPEYRHGAPLADTHRIALLDEGLYHADGQILDEVYVYGSFLQSRMYHQGVTCTDCHEPHGGGLWAPGNALCARCHQPEVFDTPEHHFHEAGTEGAQCIECHMTDRNYMVVDPRHDHSFRVPRPDLTMKIGTPNACNRCHDDQSATWARDHVVEWYGDERTRTPHYGEALHAGRTGAADALERLVRLIEDAEQPAIARASAFELLRPYPPQLIAATIARGLEDDDPLVRRAATGLLDGFPGQFARTLGEKPLADPARTVRLEAAMALAGVIRDDPDLDRALEEYRRSQQFNADRAEAHMNLGNLEAKLGDLEAAERAYRAAAVRDPNFVPAVVNLADLLRASGRDAEGERLLVESLERRETAEAHHALGLLLVRRQQPEAALAHLGAAYRLRPESMRYAYVFAVALHDLGDGQRAIEVLEAAHERHPNDRNLLSALVMYCGELGRDAEARAWAERLQTLQTP